MLKKLIQSTLPRGNRKTRKFKDINMDMIKTACETSLTDRTVCIIMPFKVKNNSYYSLLTLYEIQLGTERNNEFRLINKKSIFGREYTASEKWLQEDHEK